MPPKLTLLGRRVLGHLPVWVNNEKQHVEAEGGKDISVRSYTLSEFTLRLAEDPATFVKDEDGVTRSLTERECEISLQGLLQIGLAEVKAGDWRMTKLGYEAIVAPDEPEDQVPGAVTVGLHPAVGESKAFGG
jgi:hypothetical protein